MDTHGGGECTDPAVAAAGEAAGGNFLFRFQLVLVLFFFFCQ